MVHSANLTVARSEQSSILARYTHDQSTHNSDSLHTQNYGYSVPLTSPMKQKYERKKVENNMSENGEITCKVITNLCVLNENDRGYSKEANIVQWNDGDPKLDIREWTPSHRPLKGITLTERELQMLRNALNVYFYDQEETA